MFGSERPMKKSRREIKAAAPPKALLLSIAFSLALVTVLLFGRTLFYPFINFDDPAYILERPEITRGMTLGGIGWSLSHVHGGNWHPLTSISHMLACQWFDGHAGAHHFVNVLLHALTASTLFLVLRRMTGALWRSAFVAALFAIYPLRVESVAWIAERKDVLSAVFFFLTLIAYSHYVVAPSFRRYVTMSILFALGLMSKPMLVTTPVILLLVDYWPFKRFTDAKSFRRLAIEKIPLFGLSLVCSVITLSLQLHSPTLTGQLPLWWRLENALVTYVVYIWQIFWPTN